MHHFWPISLNLTTSSLSFLWLSWILKFLSFSRNCDTVPWHFLKTPGYYLGARYICLGTNCIPGAFLLGRLDSSSWLYCPGSECFMTYQTSEAFLWMPGNWKKEWDAYLRRKKKLKLKKKNRNWGFKVLHCLEISASAPPEKPNVCRYKYFHMFLINFIGLWRALDSDWEFLICAIFYEL